MDSSSVSRTLRVAGLLVATTFAFTACSGGGTSVPGGVASTGSSGGNGSSNGSGATSGSATASPTPVAAGSGSSTAPSATATPTAVPTSSGATSPASSPTPTSAASISPVSSLVVGPQVIDAALGSAAQVGVLDPGYTGPIEVTAVGNQIVGTVLSSAINLQDGVLQGASGTADVLDVNLAQLASLGVLGQSGTLLNVCETGKTPSVCQQVALVQNATAQEIGSNLSSAVITPGTFQTLMLVGKTGLLGFTNFTVTSSNNNVTVTNLGNGSYALGAVANATPPISATITATDGNGHTVSIPVMVL